MHRPTQRYGGKWVRAGKLRACIFRTVTSDIKPTSSRVWRRRLHTLLLLKGGSACALGEAHLEQGLLGLIVVMQNLM
eukprot:1070275-Pelagomonas_calceolata.AAC.2